MILLAFILFLFALSAFAEDCSVPLRVIYSSEKEDTDNIGDDDEQDFETGNGLQFITAKNPNNAPFYHNLQKRCYDFCHQINDKCEQKETDRNYCPNVILNNCIPPCGPLCTHAADHSLQVKAYQDCESRFEKCRDTVVAYCAKFFYWCLPSASSLSCDDL